jgi:protease II
MGRGTSVSSAGRVRAEAPLAVREPVEHVIHGDRRVDHYAWMKDKKDPRVVAYLEAENAYADGEMKSTEGFQEKLYQEMLGRILQTDLSVPYSLRGYSYYTRTEEGKQYPIYCRKRATSDQISDIRNQEEEVLVDLNELAVGHTYMGLAILEVSDDNHLLAYGTDTTGFRQYVLEVKDLRTGEMIPFRAERVTSAAWAMDNRTLFYVTEDEVTKRSNQLWRHEFGAQFRRREGQETDNAETQSALSGAEEEAGGGDLADLGRRSPAPLRGEGGLEAGATRLGGGETQEAEARSQDGADMGRSNAAPLQGETRDELIYEEKDERFRIDVERSRSGAYLFLECNSHTTSEIRYLRADSPFSGFQVVAEREDEHEYYLDHHPGSAEDEAGGIFFIRTNSGGRTYRLVTAPVEDPARTRWHEVIANRPGVMLAGLEAFRTHLVLTEREDGLPHLRIVDLTREAASALAASRRLDFAEPAYHATLGMNPEFDSEMVRFQYESMVTPRSVYDYDVRTGERILKKQQPVLGDFVMANYVSERLHAKAADGTLVPVSLVRRKETARDGNAPLLLYGYGSYGLAMPVTFSSNRLSLLDRGMVYAIAHVRGGGELGKPWHDAGRMHQKMNTFTDFISCAEHLIAGRYTSAERLVIEGGSAGGLLTGAVANMRAELFHVVVSHVPFVDVLNTMLDPSLPLTVGEYEEWGNPQLADDYFYMKQYCPYTNVERKNYPRMLVKTAWNDSQVMYWEAAKYVAKLRAMKTDENVLLLKTNMGAGHGGPSGRYDFLREIAFDYAFLLGELGIRE